ncbi:MAG: hypothetical protein LBI99_04260, partial [Propionibacteriaceae bacterium]|nr:hypothetical protein [Propionibacteriaceae bacterium]
TAGLDPEDYPSKDPDDSLVIGAAHRSPADIIVPRNLVDFPQETLSRYGLRAQTADQLLKDLLTANPDQVIGVLRTMQAAMNNPPVTLDNILDSLKNAGAPNFVAAVRPRLSRQ